MPSEVIELNRYNDKKIRKRSTFLGKVKIVGNAFAKSRSETLVYYPPEKMSIFSQIKGEIGLEIWFVNENPPVAKVPTEAQERKSDTAPPPPAGEEKTPEKEEDKKTEEKKEDEKKEEEKPKEEKK